MEKAREIVGSILKERTVDNIYFVGCGGSLVGFYPAKYFLTCEAKKLKTGYCNSNEFVYATPKRNRREFCGYFGISERRYC